jgi:hypothetical protein
VTEIRALAFGQTEDGIWGVAWLPGSGNSARLAVARGDARELLDGELESGGPDEAWSLEGEGLSLVVAPSGPVAHGGVSRELESTDRLCAIDGRVQIAGSAAEVECPGWRSTAGAQADLAAFDSARWLAGWLGPNEGFSLTALRPRKARGHDADLIAATLIDDPSPPLIDDPRLSTTYAEGGLPSRVGLELWFEAEDEDGNEDEPDHASSHQYPRRAAGEPAALPLEWETAGFELHASLLNWHSRGRAGPGVYVLARRR